MIKEENAQIFVSFYKGQVCFCVVLDKQSPKEVLDSFSYETQAIFQNIAINEAWKILGDIGFVDEKQRELAHYWFRKVDNFTKPLYSQPQRRPL